MQASHIQEMPKEQATNEGKGTGFPEPLSEKTNTTRCHPDADTSENATIEGLHPVRMSSHTRNRSFLGRYNSRNKAVHGRLPPTENGLYETIQDANESTEQNNGKKLAARRDSGVHAGASQESLQKEKDSDSQSQGSESSKKHKRSLSQKLRLKR